MNWPWTRAHLDDGMIARFVDEGERIDALSAEKVRHLGGCARCQALLRGHRRARALLLRHDPEVELPLAVESSRPGIPATLATSAVLVLAFVVAFGALMRFGSTGSTAEPTASAVAEVHSSSPSVGATRTVAATQTDAPSLQTQTPETPGPETTPSPAAPTPGAPTPEAPAPTPTRAAPPSQPTVAPSPTPLRYCTSTDVSVAIVPEHGGMPDPLYWQGNMGRNYATFALTNMSSTACRVLTFSTPELINGDGKVLIEGGTVAGGGAKTVQPGQTLTATVVTMDLCGAPPIVAPVTVGFSMGDGKNAVAPPISPTDTQAVPPCTGDPTTESGDIAIEGWH